MVAAKRMRSIRRPRIGASHDRGPGRKQARISAIAAAQVLDRPRPVGERPEHVHQHHLPVEAGEVVAEERLDDHALVGLEALLERPPQRPRRPPLRPTSGEKVSAGEPSRSPGIRKRPGATDAAAAREAAR